MSGSHRIWRGALCLSLILSVMFVLVGCTSGTSGYGKPWVYQSPTAATTAQQAPGSLQTSPGPQAQSALEPFPAKAAPMPRANLPPVKVAILLPLSGPHAALGQSMLNAAQVALFDIGYDNFQLVPHDTGASAQGGAQAAQAAINGGASLILGPVFADSVKAAKAVAARSNVNIVAFSTDWTLADNRTFLMGFLPFGQVERIIGFAGSKGLKQLGVFSPNDAYGQATLQGYQNAAYRNGIKTITQKTFAPSSKTLNDEIKIFAQYEKRAVMNASGQVQVQPAPFNAVFIPAGGDTIRSVSNTMSQFGLPPSSVKRLGTGLWDDTALAANKDLEGAWFAAPSPNLRRDFERRYQDLYSAAPPRLATLAYDATALAAVLAQTGLQSTGTPAFDAGSITNPNGFAGIDGIFRFGRNGLVERGLAILEFRSGRMVVIDEAPKTFEETRTL